MNRISTIIANAMSVVLYPLLIPTYGVALLCYALARTAPLPWIWTAVAVTGTFILTCVLPVTSILILIRRGEVKDLYIDNPKERTMPYIYTLCGFGFWCYLLIDVLHAPTSIGWVAVGATVAIGLVAFINRWWKISAHLAGLGGLLGGLMSYCLESGLMPSRTTLCTWLCVCLALMYARVHLKAHTPAQVTAGWLLGLVCTFVPYCIYLFYGA